jgi:hypothetical protein
MVLLLIAIDDLNQPSVRTSPPIRRGFVLTRVVYRYLKRSLLEVKLVPFDVDTVTSTFPPVCAGETAMILVVDLTVKLVASVEPNLTAVAPVKLVPVIVTSVPPSSPPLRGESFLI